MIQSSDSWRTELQMQQWEDKNVLLGIGQELEVMGF